MSKPSLWPLKYMLVSTWFSAVCLNSHDTSAQNNAQALAINEAAASPNLTHFFTSACRAENPDRFAHAMNFMGEGVSERSLIAIRELLNITRRDSTLASGLSADQKKLLRVVQEVEKFPLGQQINHNLKRYDVWAGIQNHMIGEGWYNYDVDLLALELISKTEGRQPRYDYTDDEKFEKNLDLVMGRYFHEAIHAFQKHIWKNAHIPMACPTEQILWRIAMEAQADLGSYVLMQEYKNAMSGGPKLSWDSAQLYEMFKQSLAENAMLYKKHIGLQYDPATIAARMVTPGEFMVFGEIPGLKNNFLKDIFGGKLMPEIYKDVFPFDHGKIKKFYKEHPEPPANLEIVHGKN